MWPNDSFAPSFGGCFPPEASPQCPLAASPGCPVSFPGHCQRGAFGLQIGPAHPLLSGQGPWIRMPGEPCPASGPTPWRFRLLFTLPGQSRLGAFGCLLGKTPWLADYFTVALQMLLKLPVPCLEAPQGLLPGLGLVPDAWKTVKQFLWND